MMIATMIGRSEMPASSPKPLRPVVSTVKPRRIYVAGPMTGRARYNVDEFQEARERLLRWGAELVVIPHDCSCRVWRRHFHRPFNFDADRCDYGDPLIGEMFAEDIREVTEADAVALLPDWQASRGARIEVLTALLLGKTVIDATNQGELGTPYLVSQAAHGIARQLEGLPAVALFDA